MDVRFLPGSALVAMQAIALPATGTASGVDGEWCHPEWGTALFWEERSLGLGEHTICDWEEPPAGRVAFTTTIHCRSVYLNGEEVVEMDHKSHRFQARQLGPDTLHIQFNDDAPVEMTRCDF